VIFIFIHREPLNSFVIYCISAICPEGYTRLHDRCYLFDLDRKTTWGDARSFCNLRNTQLLRIQSWVTTIIQLFVVIKITFYVFNSFMYVFIISNLFMYKSFWHVCIAFWTDAMSSCTSKIKSTQPKENHQYG